MNLRGSTTGTDAGSFFKHFRLLAVINMRGMLFFLQQKECASRIPMYLSDSAVFAFALGCIFN
jgi:hypothetical protein